jgi:peptide deformylase
MILHVAVLGHPVLRRRAEPIAPEELATPELQRFLDDLTESMLFHDGVGLAAPQVFSPRRAVAVWVPPEMDEAGLGLEPQVFVNPELTPLDGELIEGWEGCLSLPDLRGRVPRHPRVRVQALDRRGRPVTLELSGFPARVFQHELDHLDGIVFPDRMRGLASLAFGSALDKAASLARGGDPDADEDDDDEPC